MRPGYDTCVSGCRGTIHWILDPACGNRLARQGPTKSISWMDAFAAVESLAARAAGRGRMTFRRTAAAA